MKLLIATCYLLIAICFLLPASALALDRMESDAYRLKFTNLNMTSGSKSSDNYNILDTIGQTAPGQYDSAGYIVKSGFPYIKTIIPFAFTISDLSIDFGTLTPSTFFTQSHTLTVSSGGAGGYSVKAYEDHPLKLGATATTIPDTTCDTPCTQTTAAVWTTVSNFGFGYNMTGDDIPAAFINSTYFKQFADASAAETAQTVMSDSDVGANQTATVTYKVNVSATQGAGDYQTNVVYIATPGY